MPIRNPFARRPGLNIPNDENSRPGSASSNKDVAHPGFERVDTVGSKASSALSIRSARSQDTGEYKMSVVNDSGVYLPPSPVEKEPTWPRRYLSRTSTDTKSSVGGEIEHFSISRESFDSYRRSFDISARSPIQSDSTTTRQSLDSRFPRLPHHRSIISERRLEGVPPTAEEPGFEDVGLGDDSNNIKHHAAAAPAKKRGFFSKFGSDENEAPPSATTAGNGTAQHAGIASRFLLPGRKRGQSGQGAELGVMPLGERPMTASTVVETEVQS